MNMRKSEKATGMPKGDVSDIVEAIEKASKEIVKNREENEGVDGEFLDFLTYERILAGSLLETVGQERLKELARQCKSLEEFRNKVREEALRWIREHYTGELEPMRDIQEMETEEAMQGLVMRVALEYLFEKYKKESEKVDPMPL
jgi:hypothetical protein